MQNGKCHNGLIKRMASRRKRKCNENTQQKRRFLSKWNKQKSSYQTHHWMSYSLNNFEKTTIALKEKGR